MSTPKPGKYYLETTLDLGDIGVVAAEVHGSVRDSGLFDVGSGYFETKIDRITVLIPDGTYASVGLTDRVENVRLVNVTKHVNKAAMASLCEELERMHLNESREGA